MSIPFIGNIPIRPFSVSAIGDVSFTDGTTNDLIPTQTQCEAYGYTYDKSSGLCMAFNFTPNLGLNLNKEDNNVQGSRNTVQTGTTNTYIMGDSNSVGGLSRNNIIIGSQNQIANGVSNTFVYGTLGGSTTRNSIVLGGNNGADILGERQNITLIYGVQTTSNVPDLANLNNTVDSFFQPIENSVFYFQSEILAVRVGGASLGGAVGDYKSWVERGVVKNAAGTLSISRSQTAIVDSGTTTGWSTENTVSGSDFRLSVTGARQITLEWIATIRITEIRTSVTLT